LYYGNSRSISAAELQSYDLVITTYHTLAGEYGGPQESGGPSRSKKKKVEGVLMDIPWKVSKCTPFFLLSIKADRLPRESSLTKGT
jgi:hypothetical protein